MGRQAGDRDGLRARLRHSAVAPERRQRVADLRRAARGAAPGAAVALLDQAHTLARNLPLAHARLHLALARRQAQQGALREALAELERAAVAPLASGLRRLAGRAPDAPLDPGLAATLRAALGPRRGGSGADGGVHAEGVEVADPVQR